MSREEFQKSYEDSLKYEQMAEREEERRGKLTEYSGNPYAQTRIEYDERRQNGYESRFDAYSGMAQSQQLQQSLPSARIRVLELVSGFGRRYDDMEQVIADAKVLAAFIGVDIG